jgi:hypothetical protein
MSQALSIDNFIDCHAEDLNIAICGKLAIARAILAAEAESTLGGERRRRGQLIDFSKSSDTWYNKFFQILTENCRLKDLPDRLRRVAIVTFNYDRCIEHYLFNAVQNYYGVGDQQAAAILGDLEIHHPYGMVGGLPWMKKSIEVEFGADIESDQLVAVSRELRTFTEGTDPRVSNIDDIRSSMRSARRVVFLGFAFHPLNMNLLYGGSQTVGPNAQRVFCSSYGISESNRQLIREELIVKTGASDRDVQIPIGLTCSKLLDEFHRSLSMA